jgi:hypothetical protein
VPKLLTQEQKPVRVMISQECLLTIPTPQIWLMMTFLKNLSEEKRTTGQHQLPLANITLTQDTFKSNLERAIRIITTEEFAAAYRR